MSDLGKVIQLDGVLEEPLLLGVLGHQLDDLLRVAQEPIDRPGLQGTPSHTKQNKSLA